MKCFKYSGQQAAASRCRGAVVTRKLERISPPFYYFFLLFLCLSESICKASRGGWGKKRSKGRNKQRYESFGEVARRPSAMAQFTLEGSD